MMHHKTEAADLIFRQQFLWAKSHAIIIIYQILKFFVV